jgi:hypothetical protein
VSGIPRFANLCWLELSPNLGDGRDQLPVIRDIQRTGIESHNAIAAELNRRGVKTARGGKWAHVQVGRILARAFYGKSRD